MRRWTAVSILSETTVKVEIVRDVEVIQARREGRALGEQLGSSSDLVVVPTAISELARNILRYAGRGEIRLATVRDGGRTGIEVVAADSGPGIVGRYRALESALGGEDGFRGGG